MTKTRQEIIEKLKYSEKQIQIDAEKNRLQTWYYGAVPKVYISGAREKAEALKMEAEGLIVEYNEGFYTTTKKGRKELLYPDVKTA